MLLTESFPIIGSSPASWSLLWPRVKHGNRDRERSEKLSNRAKCQGRCKASAGSECEPNFMSGCQQWTTTRTRRRGDSQASEVEGRWLNVSSKVEAIVGKERWVEAGDDCFPRCWDFNRRRGRRDGSCPICWLFFLFFFSFCNHVLFVFRYKEPYAARARRKNKPIRQNHCRLHLFMGKIKHPESIGKVYST